MRPLNLDDVTQVSVAAATVTKLTSEITVESQVIVSFVCLNLSKHWTVDLLKHASENPLNSFPPPPFCLYKIHVL